MGNTDHTKRWATRTTLKGEGQPRRFEMRNWNLKLTHVAEFIQHGIIWPVSLLRLCWTYPTYVFTTNGTLMSNRCRKISRPLSVIDNLQQASILAYYLRQYKFMYEVQNWDKGEVCRAFPPVLHRMHMNFIF
jgi:hypothetical protein